MTGYLLGSVPSAYIIARLTRGIDIRTVGGGNMGAGNVMREVGKPHGIATALADVGKGAAAIFVARALGVGDTWLLSAGFAALLGHNFPACIGFKGGQGVACAAGVFLVLTPQVMLFAIPFMLLMLIITRHIFSSVILTVPVFLALLWFFEGHFSLMAFALVIVFYIGYRSRHGLKQVARVISSGEWRNHLRNK